MMRIVLLASGEFALPTLDRLARQGYDIPLVVTQPARPSGRGRRTTTTPVRRRAEELGLNTLETPDINDPSVVRHIRSLNPRLGLVIAFGQKLGPGLLATAPRGYINLHASLLPKYRGAAPINWAIVKGEKVTGCTVFRIVERMDAGPILTSCSTDIQPEETAGELHDRLAVLGVEAVRASLQLFEKDSNPEGRPQDDHEATLAPKLNKKDGRVRFDRSADEVVRHVHGMTPWPGATALFNSSDGRWEKVQLTRVRAVLPSGQPDLEPGRMDERLHIATADGFLELIEIKPSSGRAMTWREYVNGRHVRPGDWLATGDRPG